MKGGIWGNLGRLLLPHLHKNKAKTNMNSRMAISKLLNIFYKRARMFLHQVLKFSAKHFPMMRNYTKSTAFYIHTHAPSLLLFNRVETIQFLPSIVKFSNLLCEWPEKCPICD